MNFNTIVTNFESENIDNFDIESVLSKIPKKAGVFYTTGKVNEKSTCVLHTGLADINLSKKIILVLKLRLDNKWYKYKINTINYSVIQEKKQRDKIFLELFKKLKPKVSYSYEVNTHIGISQRENVEKIVNGKRGYDFLEEKLGDLSRFTRDISEDSIFKKFDKDIINNYIKQESGVYFLYNDREELMYIGKATKLKSRLLNHLSGKANTLEVCHNFKKFKCLYMKCIDTKDYEIFFINIYKPPLNEDGVLTYVSEKFDIRYNSIVKECGSFKEYLRFKCAKEEAEEWLIKGYFDDNLDREIFSKRHKVHWTLYNLLMKAKLPFPKGTSHWRDWDKQLLNILKEGKKITFLKEDFINQGDEKLNKFEEGMEFKTFTIYRDI